MSLFLGPIHHWLFNKIRFQDEWTAQLLSTAETAGWQESAGLAAQLDERFGALENGPLEELIDGGNIHGWLQERVSLVENRLAYLVTRLVQADAARLGVLAEASERFGAEHALESGLSAPEAFKALDALLLNGMPCDRVNELTENEPARVSWREAVDIHADYWTANGGEVQHFRQLRKRLMQGLVAGAALKLTVEDNCYSLEA